MLGIYVMYLFLKTSRIGNSLFSELNYILHFDSLSNQYLVVSSSLPPLMSPWDPLERDKRGRRQKGGGQQVILLQGASEPPVSGPFRLQMGQEGGERKEGEKGTHANLRKRNSFRGIRRTRESRVGSVYTRSGQGAMVKSSVQLGSG